MAKSDKQPDEVKEGPPAGPPPVKEKDGQQIYRPPPVTSMSRGQASVTVGKKRFAYDLLRYGSK